MGWGGWGVFYGSGQNVEMNMFLQKNDDAFGRFIFHAFNKDIYFPDADKIENYENVIRNIHYYHNEPSKLSNRTLTLSCSSQNGRFVSNKFVVRVSVRSLFYPNMQG